MVPRARHTLVLGTLALGAVGLLFVGCTTYQVQQSSLVPAATLPPAPTLRGRGDLYIADDTVTFLSQPKLAPNEDAGLWVPRTQLAGAASWRPMDWMSLRFHYQHGFSEGAIAAAPTTIEAPDADVIGFGSGMTFKLQADDSPLAFVLGFDWLMVSVPSRFRIVAECPYESPCMPVTGNEHTDRDTVLVAAGTFGVGWTFADWGAVQFTTGLRNHPTNVESFTTTDSTPNARVYEGPINVHLAATAELYANEWLSFVPVLQIPILTSPVRYGPMIGLGVRATFDTVEQPKAQM